MSRKKPLKSPFVVTASVAAAATFAIACGGKTSGNDLQGSGQNPPAQTTCTTSTRAGEACIPGESSCWPEVPYPTLLNCTNGVWYESPGIANPPPPEPTCPAVEPRITESCYVSGQQCTYLDRCPDRPNGSPSNRRYQCLNGTWSRQDDYRATCPATMPKAGESCEPCAGEYPAECTYPDGTGPGCPPPAAVCDPKSLTWQLAVSSCNPPPPDAGSGGGDNGP